MKYNDDIVDKIFDYIESKTKWLYQNDLIKNWFNIISWTTLTAIVIAIAKQSESFFLYFVGVISFILVFFYSWHTLFENIKSQNKFTIITLILVPLTVIGLLIYMTQAITFIINKNA